MKGDSTLCESPYANIALDEDTSYLDEISAPREGRRRKALLLRRRHLRVISCSFIQGLSANLATARSPRGHLTPIK